MNLRKIARARIAFALLLGLVGFAPAVSAVDLSTLIDIDNSDATGCTVGTFQGADFQLVTTVDTSVDPPMITGQAVNQCVGAVFVPFVPTLSCNPFPLSDPPPPGWPAPPDAGFDAVEAYVSLCIASVVVPPPPLEPDDLVQLGFFSGPVSAPVDTVGPIDVPVPAPGVSVIEIPTLGEWGLLSLAVLLFLAGFAMLRHRRSRAGIFVGLLLLTGGMGIAVAAANHAADGNLADWNGHTPVLDPADAPINFDIRQVWATIEPNDILFVRFDIDASPNQPPVVTTTAGSTAFTEDGGPVVVDAGVTVTDDGANLASAAVTITNPQDGAAETLAATSCPGLTVTPGLNSLSITGSQPLATYQTCLQSVTFNDSSQNPGITPRVISFVVNDGTANSAAATKNVTVAPVNDAPVVTTTAGDTAFAEGGGAVVVDSGVTVTDVDDTNLESATVSLASAPDGAAEVLNATSCAGLTVAPGNPMTITGSQPLATYQTCLQSVTYDNSSLNPNTANRTVNFVVNDGDINSNTAAKTVTVAPSPNAPTVTTTVGTTAFTEDGGAVVVDSGVTVTDPDDTNLESATVSLASAPDGAAEVLNATSCAGLTVTPGNPLTITGSQPLATYQTCLQSVTYNNTDQDPDTTNRTVNFVANDGDNNSNTAAKTVSMTAANDAPVVTTTAGTTAFTEDGGAVVVDSGVTVTDVDDANLESATVSLASAPDGASEVLNATSCAGLTVTPGNPLTITGSQPKATYQTCLQSVTYNNTDQDPDTTNRTVNFVVNDGDTNSNTASKTVSIAVQPDAPVVTTTAGTTVFTEDAGAVVVDAGVTVSDADDTNLESATMSLASAPDGAAEVLNATTCVGLTVTPGNPLTITGSQSKATYQTCLQSVTYNNTDQDPDTTNRTVNFVVNDGDNNSNTAAKTVSITAQLDAPVVTTTGGTTVFTEDGGAVVVDAGVTVSDADDTNLESATVSLASAPDGAAEVLNATSCAGLTVTPGNPLTITGSQPLATYQACLQSVTYNNTDQDPDTTNRTVNFVVNDGDSNSNTGMKTVSVAALNDAPIVTTTAGTTGFTEDTGAVVVDAGVTVSDVDDANLESATVSLTSAPDGAAEVLNATSCVGLTVTPGNPLTITGSQPKATYQTCLQSVTYNNTDQDPDTTNRTVNFVVNDGDVNSNTAPKTVSVAAANDAPVVTTTGGNTAFTEDGGAVVVDSGVTVSDIDDTNLESATVSLASAPDGAAEVLNATACAGLTVTPGNPLTITGSQPKATYQTCLQSVTYNNTSQNPNTTNRTVNFVVNDGDVNSNTASKTVSVTAAPDAPVVTTTGGVTAFTEDGGPVTVDSGVTVTDVDDTNLESATVSLASAPDGAAETLNATACAGLTVTPGNPLTITGSQSKATYQACLQSVTYNNTDQDPDTTNRTVNFVVNDGDSNSNTGIKTVSVTAQPDPPVVTMTGGVTAFTEDGGPVTVDSGVMVTDVDDTNLESAAVSLASAPDGAAETLNATSCVGLTVIPGNPLTITGSQPKATYQTCLQSVTYNNTSQNPNTTNRTVNFVVNDGDTNSNTGMKTVSVTAVNDAPMITTNPVTYTTAGNTQLHVEGKTLAGVVAVTDSQGVDAKAGPFTDVDGPVAPAIVDASGPTTMGGTYDIDTDGSFTYVPPVGFTGTDSFAYQVTDTVTPANGTVNITVSSMVWYVHDVTGTNNPSGGDDGRSTNAFELLSDAIAAATAASTVNDIVFVFEGNTATTPHIGDVTISETMRLWGEGIGLTLPVHGTLVAAGNQPRVRDNVDDAGEDNAVNVDTAASGTFTVEIRGLDLEGIDNAVDVTSAGTEVINLELSNNNVRGAGLEGFDLNYGTSSGTSSVTIADNTAAATNAGIDLSTTGGASVTLALHDNSAVAVLNGINVNDGSTGTITITQFDDNVVDGNTGTSGMLITNAIFDATPGNPINPVSGGVTAIGQSGNGVGTNGMVLTNVTGDLAFTDLDIFNSNGTGLFVSSTGALNAGAGTGFKISVPASVATVDSNVGPAVSVNNASITLPINFLRSTNSATTGLSLISAFGGVGSTALSAGSGQIADPGGASGTAVNISGGNGNITLGIPIINNSGNAIVITGRGSDTVTFTGAITETGSGISLTTNGGATMSFRGGLSATTGSNAAFTATGGGIVEVCDENPCNPGSTGLLVNTLTTTTGTALNVANTTISANNLEFRSISAGTAASGPANGIVVNNTGAMGGLKVKGTGSAGSGGTIQRCGTGISLTSTRNVLLDRMQLNDHTDFAIRGTSVVNFAVANSVISGANGNDAAADEGSVRFNDLTGTADITDCNISGAVETNVRVVNTSGTLNRLTIDGTTIGANHATTGDDGLFIQAAGSSVVNVTVQDSFFTSARGDLVNTDVPTGGGTLDLIFTGNTLSNNHPGIVSGGGGTTFSAVGGTFTYDILNNTFRDANGAALAVSGGNNGVNTSGTIEGNTIGVAGAGNENSGSISGSDIAWVFAGGGTHTARIHNNNLRGYNNHGILVQVGDQMGNPTNANVTVTQNTVQNPGNINTDFNAIHLNHGVVGTDSFTSCVDIGGAGVLRNVVNGGGSGAVSPNNNDIRLRQRQATTVRLPSYGGANNDNAAVQTYLTGRNTLTTVNASNTVPTGGGYIGGVACTQP